MVKKAEERRVTRESLNPQAFLDRVLVACESRMARGAFGALSFEQLLALTHRKKDLRMGWLEFQAFLVELTKSGALLCQNKRYYPRQCLERTQDQMRIFGSKLDVPSSAEPPPKKPRPDRQLPLFGSGS